MEKAQKPCGVRAAKPSPSSLHLAVRRVVKSVFRSKDRVVLHLSTRGLASKASLPPSVVSSGSLPRTKNGGRSPRFSNSSPLVGASRTRQEWLWHQFSSGGNESASRARTTLSRRITHSPPCFLVRVSHCRTPASLVNPLHDYGAQTPVPPYPNTGRTIVH